MSLSKSDAVVPKLWHLETTNVLLSAEKRCEISVGEVERFMVQLESLPIIVDPLTSKQCFNHISADKALRKAAKKAGVDIYLS